MRNCTARVAIVNKSAVTDGTALADILRRWCISGVLIMPTDLDAVTGARKCEAQAQLQTEITILLVCVVIFLFLGMLVLLFA